MVGVAVATTPPTSLSYSSSIFPAQSSAKHPSSSHTHHTFYQIFLINPTARPTSSTRSRRASRKPKTNGALSIRAYMENSNSVSGFVSKVIGSLPVIGLIARIVSDEGGVGGDMIDFAEFRRRVGKNCNINDSRAFYEFQDRRGRAGDPLYVLLCCWLAAVGAGLLKSEEILEGVARLRLSNDIEFEEQTFIAMMNEAREKRAKTKGTPPTIGMEIRAEKALEAIRVCCFGRDPIEEEDERLLNIMLNAVFPSVGEAEMRRIVRDRAEKVREGGGPGYDLSEEKPLPKEAVDRQMKDLQFLRQNSRDLLERSSSSDSSS